MSDSERTEPGHAPSGGQPGRHGGAKAGQTRDSMADTTGEEGGGRADRVLRQSEIDSLLGFTPEEEVPTTETGLKAIINSTLVSYERLPMLEIVFDRLVRLMTTSLRNLTSENVEASLENLRSIRFGDYLNSVPLPTILAVFEAKEWGNYGLVVVESNLIYSIIDVLLGGRRDKANIRVEGRPFTSIETALVHRMIDTVLADAEAAFEPLAPVSFRIDRLETNPKFAAISRPANAAIAAELEIDMEDRGGRLEILLPYATLEPIRDLLLQRYMGEKFGRDAIWENHLANEIRAAKVQIEAVLDEQTIPLREAMNLNVGQTLMLNCGRDSTVDLRCGGIPLMKGKMGRLGDHIAVQVSETLSHAKATPGRTTRRVHDFEASS